MSEERLGPGESPGFLLWQVTNRWQRELVAALKPLGLTHVQFVLLASTWWRSRIAQDAAPPTQRELADVARTDPMMTSQVVRALEDRGLLRRTRDPADGRVFRLSVTDAGAELAERAIAVVEAADRAFFAPADHAQLLRTLQTLAEG